MLPLACGCENSWDLAMVYAPKSRKTNWKEPDRHGCTLGVEQWREHSRHGNRIAKEQSCDTACHIKSMDTAGNEMRPTAVIE